MTQSKTNEKVSEYILSQSTWQDELMLLREIMLQSELTEEFKWYVPCYTIDGKNILIISAFKNYCAVNFFKGSLMSDPDKVFVQQTEFTNEARQLRFTGTQEISDQQEIIKKYVEEAIAVEKAGLKVTARPVKEYPVPDELKDKFIELPALKKAFEALTPGRQKGYLLYFSDAKQSATRTQRIEKYIQHIFDGKGINDR